MGAPAAPAITVDPRIARLAVASAFVLCAVLGVRGCWGIAVGADNQLTGFTIMIVVAVVLLLVIAGVIATRQLDFSGLFNPAKWLGK